MILNTVLEINEKYSPTEENNINNICNLNLADRDQYIYNIDNQIQSKRDLLLSKKKYLKEIEKENKYLHDVRKDYEKYNMFIVREKEDQIKALNVIQEYIDSIILSGKLTDEDIKQSKIEKREILKEIKDVKNKLQELVV